MAIGLGRNITELHVFFLSKERFMLSQRKCQLNLFHGVNPHFGYYCMQNVVIRRAQKLKMVNNIKLSLHKDEFNLSWSNVFYLYFISLSSFFLIFKFFVFLKLVWTFLNFLSLFFVGTNETNKKIGSSMSIIVLWSTID